MACRMRCIRMQLHCLQQMADHRPCGRQAQAFEGGFLFDPEHNHLFIFLREVVPQDVWDSIPQWQTRARIWPRYAGQPLAPAQVVVAADPSNGIAEAEELAGASLEVKAEANIRDIFEDDDYDYEMEPVIENLDSHHIVQIDIASDMASISPLMVSASPKDGDGTA